LRKQKFNPINQYEPQNPSETKSFWSSTGQLQREVFFTTLGFIQSSIHQIVVMWLWKNGRVPYIENFSDHLAYNIFWLLFMTYWREFHFYWVHRMMHPWWDRRNGLLQGDLGAFLYRWVHSLHHKSYNPGPWAGLSMHPVEHFIYYTCSWFPVILGLHPIHFLYTKIHAGLFFRENIFF